MRNAYEIDDRPGGIDRALRATELLCDAVQAAVQEAALPPDARCVVVVGTGLRELRTLELFWTVGTPMTIDQLHFERALNRRLHTSFPVITLANACSASSFALAVAEDFLRDGAFDFAIVGGCDTITKSMFGLLDRVNPSHPDAVRPFDRDRRGVLMGDGAAAVVLESRASADARGAPVLATLRAVGTSCDAAHETAPDPAGIARAIEDAYQRAGLAPEDIDIIMAHGTGYAAQRQGRGRGHAARDAAARLASTHLCDEIDNRAYLRGVGAGWRGHGDRSHRVRHAAAHRRARAPDAGGARHEYRQRGHPGQCAAGPGECVRLRRRQCRGHPGVRIMNPRTQAILISGHGWEIPAFSTHDSLAEGLLAGPAAPHFTPERLLGRKGLRYRGALHVAGPRRSIQGAGRRRLREGGHRVLAR